MKKVLSILLIVILMLSFTACGEKESPASGSTEGPDTSADTGNITGSMKGVELTVGTSGLFAPFSYYDTDGTTLIGYDLDFLKALQELLGFTIKGEVQAMDYSALTTSVAEGKLDIAMAALCATDARKKVMNFSDTYYDSGQITVVNKETSPNEITGVEDLKSGKYKVAVEKGTASHLYAQENLPADSIEVHDTITTVYESLEQGKVDAAFQDTPGIAYYIKTTTDSKLEMAGEEFNQGQAPYAVAVSFDAAKANGDMIELLNKAIKELTDNGTMAEIDKKWCK
jgi:glutamine transport system substrate-binding protein